MIACLALLGCRNLRPGAYTRELSSARQLSLRGADALQQDKWADAEAYFSEALKHSPVDERAHWGIAEVLWQKKDFASATQHMAKSAQLSGGNPDLLVRLGQMHLEQNDFEQAAHQADSALEHSRSQAAAWVLKADVLRRQGQYELAIEHYHRALIHQPDFPSAQIAVAELYRELGRPQRALATLDRLTDRRQESEIPPRALLLKGQSLADLGAHREALNCLARASQNAGEDQSQVLAEIARVQYTLGDMVASRICLGRALRRDPQNRQALSLQHELDQSFERMAKQSEGQPSWNY